MVRLLISLFMLMILVLISGCSKSIFSNQEARCPFVERGGCQSMEQVNRMVTKRRFTPDGQFVQQENLRQLPRH